MRVTRLVLMIPFYLFYFLFNNSLRKCSRLPKEGMIMKFTKVRERKDSRWNHRTTLLNSLKPTLESKEIGKSLLYIILYIEYFLHLQSPPSRERYPLSHTYFIHNILIHQSFDLVELFGKDCENRLPALIESVSRDMKDVWIHNINGPGRGK